MKKFTPRMQGTLVGVFFLIIVCFIFLIYRVHSIVEDNGKKYSKRVLNQQTYASNVLEYKRGDILDRNNTKLATSQVNYNLIFSPKDILTDEDCGENTLTVACKQFDLDESEVRAELEKRSSSKYYVGLKNISSEQKEAYDKLLEKDKQKGEDKTLNANAVYFEKNYKRVYPMNDTACSVIGYASASNEGLWGLENQYNSKLNGTTGRSYGYYSSDSVFEETVKAAQNGNSIVTTLDVNIQSIVEKKIDKFMKTTGAKNVGCIVMNPKNGEIYAMSSNVRYDLNNAFDLSQVYKKKELEGITDEEEQELLNKMWSNLCVSYSYEPGSTYKPLTVAAALDERFVTNNSTFICDGGQNVAGVPIRCVNRYGHGTLTLDQSLMESCNDVMMQIVDKMGKNTFLDYQKRFNIGYKTGIDLPGESSGVVHTVDSMGPTELATCSFGQGLTVNMVQIASAFSSVINGGNYYQPHMVKQIVDENGSVVENIQPVLVRKTVSEETSKYIRQYMYDTVEEGTGATAAVPGYSIGGKTGTAQKIPRGNGKYLVSFIGASPMDDPEVVVYVIVDEPNVEDQAHSTYAQEIVHNIMKDILPFLGVYRDESKIDEEEGSSAEGAGANASNGEETEQTNPEATAVATDAVSATAEPTLSPEQLEESGSESVEELPQTLPEETEEISETEAPGEQE